MDSLTTRKRRTAPKAHLSTTPTFHYQPRCRCASTRNLMLFRLFPALLLLLTNQAVADENFVSPHHEALLTHPYDPLTMETPIPGIHRSRGPTRDAVRPLNRVVYGYMPYWVSDTAPIHWDLLSHLSYFSVNLLVDGTIDQTSKTRLAGARYKQLRDDAKANGVKFTITITNFEPSEIATLCGANRTTAINTLVDVVKQNGAEGLNIDFEMVPKVAKANFVTFMDEITTRLHAEVPGSHVNLAGPSVDSSGAYDYDQLLTKSDGIMIMFYGCGWGGSTIAQPIAPLTAGARWSSKCNLQWVINDYFQFGGVENRKNVVVGLPFYGRRWPTDSDQIGAKTLGSGGSEVYTKCKTRFAKDRRWDSDSQTPWTTYMENGQRQQTWCDDAESLDLKLEYMVQQDVGGLGIWALGYDGAEPELWEKIEDRLTEAPVPPQNQAPVAIAKGPASAKPRTLVELDGSASFDPEGASLTYDWQIKSGPAQGTFVNGLGGKAQFNPIEEGTFRFWLTVSDGSLTSLPAEVEVVVVEPPGPIDPTDPVGPSGPQNPEQPQEEPPVASIKGCACGSSPSSGDIALFGFLLLLGSTRRQRKRR